MDKSYEFKRKSMYWYSVLNSDPDSAAQGYTDDSFVDSYSAISAILFNRLLSFESLVSPYTILGGDQSHKGTHYGNLMLPKRDNLNTFMRSKRAVFNKIGIASIVHDTKVIGELITQMEDKFKKSSDSDHNGTAIIQHREGINNCLRYMFQIVRDDVQNYERFKLKFESSLQNHLKVMTENLTEARSLDDAKGFDPIPNSYLHHFVPPEIAEPTVSPSSDADTETDEPKPDSQPAPEKGSEPADVNIVSFSRSLVTGAGSLKYQDGVFNISTNFLDPSEMDNEQITGTLVQQHARTVNNINDQLKASELSTINSVQERLAEISSMFEKFSGTLVQQMDLFENINANVMQSLTNIEKTQDTLKKTAKQKMSLLDRGLCYAFVGVSAFLLLIDFVKTFVR